MQFKIKRHTPEKLLCFFIALFFTGAVSAKITLTAPDGTSGDRFGKSVALSGDVALVGSDSSNTGAVYVYTRVSVDQWVASDKLTANDANSYDSFGYSLAISGDTALVGAIGDDDKGTDSGSVYIFQKNRTGTWFQVNKLLASDGAVADYFGSSIALDGNTVLIGASGKKGGGAVYVYTRNAAGVWTEQARLTGDDSREKDFFGSSLSLSGNTAVVGATGRDDMGSESGAVYIFTRNNSGEWVQQTKLLADDRQAGDAFGSSVSLSENTVLIGAAGANSADGAAYLFIQSSQNQWIQQSKLSASNAASNSYFGHSVSLESGVALIGAYGQGASAAYLFIQNTTGNWVEQAKEVSARRSDAFGYSVALDRGNALIGSIENGGKGQNPGKGSAYLILDITKDNDSDGVLNIEDKCPDTYDPAQLDTDSDGLGNACDPDDDNDQVLDGTDRFPLDALESADFDNDGIGNNSDPDVDNDGLPNTIENKYGLKNQDPSDANEDLDNDGYNNIDEFRAGTSLSNAAETPASVLALHYKILANDGRTGDYFGAKVSLSGDTALVSASWNYKDTPGANKVYVYVRNSSGKWSLQAQLKPASYVEYERFGSALSLSGNTALIGAAAEKNRSGSAYIFIRNSLGIWQQQARLLTEEQSDRYFGNSVSLDNNRALVGSAGSGAAYLFVRDSASRWALEKKLIADQPVAGSLFGVSVALSNDIAIVGAAGINSAYIFKRSQNSWIQHQKLTAENSNVNSFFGGSVALLDDTALIGAYQDESSGESAGAAYLFVNSASAGWVQKKKLLAMDGLKSDQFGGDVALAEGIAVVGAKKGFNIQDAEKEISGAAYIFVKDESNQWSRQGKVFAQKTDLNCVKDESKPEPDPCAKEDWFGHGVAVSNDRVLIGAPGVNDIGENSGAVYIFENISGDRDGDGLLDIADNCPDVKALSQRDTDGDGLGDVCDDDDDGDGVPDENDPFPKDISESIDEDGDGVGDNADPDLDNDGLPDVVEDRYDLDEDDPNDAVKDLDGDGYSNIVEFRAGTKLDDATSKPGLLSNLHYKLLAKDGAINDSFGFSVAFNGDTALIGASGDNNNSGAAYVYVRDATGEWIEQAKLVSEEGGANSYFGHSVSLLGDMAMVGAQGETVGGRKNVGVVYVFVRNESGQWRQESKIIPEDRVSGGVFGFSISQGDNSALIGAHGAKAVYLFERDNSGRWLQKNRIIKAQGSIADFFGFSVSHSENMLVIGAKGEERVYIYEKDITDRWVQSAVLQASDESDKNFGYSVSLSENTLLIGAYKDEEKGQGSSYVFVRSANGQWTQQARLTSGKASGSDGFGVSVSLFQNVALIGASLENAAYLFYRDASGNWQKQIRLVALDGSGGLFARSLSLSEDIAVVSRKGDDDNALNAGAVYIFSGMTTDSDGDGLLDVADNCIDVINVDQANFDNDGLGNLCDTDDDNDGVLDADDYFPFDASESADYDGDKIGDNIDPDADNDGLPDLLEEYYDELNPLDSSDADKDLDGDGYSNLVEYYAGTPLNNEDITPQMVRALHYKIVSHDGTKDSSFGNSVSLDGDTALIGVPNDKSSVGAAYVYIKTGDRWRLQAKLVADDPLKNSFFGNSVSLSGNTALIGARGNKADDIRSGAAYIFVRDSKGNWKQQARLKPSEGKDNARFGYKVALSGSTALISEYKKSGKVIGSAYIFVRDKQSRWKEQARLLANDGKTGDFFGSSVALSAAGDVAAIGAHLVNESSSKYDSGAVYLFQRNGAGKWEQQVRLASADKVTNGYFGSSVSLYENLLLVGAYGEVNNRGAAYLFQRDSDKKWKQIKRLSNESQESFDYFGRSVSLSDGIALIGANGRGPGTSYLYMRDKKSRWIYAGQANSADGQGDDSFGFSVSLSGDAALVGAYKDDDNGKDSGSAYIFKNLLGDDDGDGILNIADNCPAIKNANQRDSNENGLGDVCDPDSKKAKASRFVTADGGGAVSLLIVLMLFIVGCIRFNNRRTR